MDSDSDRTVDSDELKEMIVQKKKRSLPLQSKIHAISDSDSDGEVIQKKTKIDKSNQKDIKSNPVLKNLPNCSYGNKCYRKNPDHIKNFSHEDDTNLKATKNSTSSETSKLSCKLLDSCFYLTKVHGIDRKYNNEIALDIKDILSLKDGGSLISSVQFNYMFDVKWLIQQYPDQYRKCPITIVHGEQRESKKSLEKSGESFPNIRFCQAKLNIPFGTHHTKMMFLLYEKGFRVVIHTSNIVDSDWFQKTQGIWMSPILPKVSASGTGDSKTGFKADLIEYIKAYEAPELENWCKIIAEHDFSQVKVFLIGSIPGRHVGSKKTTFGHLKLRKVLNLHGNPKDIVKTDWHVIGQFSSIGSLGGTPDQWLTTEFLTSLSTTKGTSLVSQSAPLKLVYPTVDNVRKSLEGYPAGASLPYSIKVVQKQPYFKQFLHVWKSNSLGRTEAMPHIKTYLRVSPDNTKIGWFLVTSANLSKAAWGALEKKGAQFMIRSYELGVLFLPELFGKKLFTSPGSKDINNVFPVPYDLPLEPYSNTDLPWVWDIPHMKAPDRFGNMWCPR